MADGSIGTPVLRREDYRFLTGQGTYTDDINRPGQLYASILRSPHANARISRLDTSGAASSPGVVAVFTGKDMAADEIGGLPCGWLVNFKDGSPMKEPPHPVLATDRVRHVGDPVVVVIAATAVVALLSEFLVGTIEAVRASLGVTEVFVGVVVVAIVGNAAEHSTAIVMAVKNKMDLSVGIAIGSSLQVALFVAPVLVFLSYFLGRPMNLEFSLPEVFAVVASVYIIFQISGDGETNWIEGVQLLSVYLILGILFFYLPEPHVALEYPQ